MTSFDVTGPTWTVGDILTNGTLIRQNAPGLGEEQTTAFISDLRIAISDYDAPSNGFFVHNGSSDLMDYSVSGYQLSLF